MKCIRGLIAILPLTVFSVSLAFSEPTPSLLETRFISEVDAIIPGKKITVGLVQKMSPGYHTYWRNPGTLGLATRIEWKLPPGFIAGPIQWPVPQVTRMAAYQVWGYEGETVLLTDIMVPKDLRTGARIVLKAEVTWMCCAQQCHPGFAELSMTLPVRTKAKSDATWEKRFRTVRDQQPRESNAWKLTCRRAGDQYLLSVQPIFEKTYRDSGRSLAPSLSPIGGEGARRAGEGDFGTIVPKRDRKTGVAILESRSSRREEARTVLAKENQSLLTSAATVHGSITLPIRPFFFGYDRQISSDRGQEVERTGGGFRITMQQEEFTGERLNRLTGILVAETEWSKGCRVLAVNVPIEESKQ